MFVFQKGERTVEESRDDIVTVINIIIGLAAMIALGYTHAVYMSTIHENWMWFSNIKVTRNVCETCMPP